MRNYSCIWSFICFKPFSLDVFNKKLLIYGAFFLSTTLLARNTRFEHCPALSFENSREGFRSLIDRIQTYVPQGLRSGTAGSHGPRVTRAKMAIPARSGYSHVHYPCSEAALMTEPAVHFMVSRPLCNNSSSLDCSCSFLLLPLRLAVD
jgi:hypothetical protein